MSLLDVRGLNVRFDTPDGEVHAVKDLSFELERGETLGIELLDHLVIGGRRWVSLRERRVF